MKSHVSKFLFLSINITLVNLSSKPEKLALFKPMISPLFLVSLLPTVSILSLRIVGFPLCALSELTSLYVIYSCLIYWSNK